jgi:DNA-binding protein YbaB
MKCIAASVLATALLSLILGGHQNNAALAFGGFGVPRPTITRTTATRLHLFGGANKPAAAGGAAKEPGMMERLAMIQKAQQMAQKKKKLDEELAKDSFQGSAADGKVTITIKFIPPTSPMDPSPDYAATGVDVDDEYFAATSASDLSMAFKQAYAQGIATTNQAIADKYKVLQEDMMAAMQGMKPN